MPLEVTDAVRAPAAVGLLENVTVRDVADAAVTTPTAPLLKVTAFLEGTTSKPNPLMVTVLAFAARLALLDVMTGVTVATWIAFPLALLFVVTIAVKLPGPVGLVENVTVRVVAVAAVTVPTAPLLKTTVL